MLKVDNIKMSFEEKQVLRGFSFEVKRGEIQAILGKNGAGKTTLFRIILSILKPDSGSVTLDGKKIELEDSYKLGFLPEERSLLKKYTICEQLMFFAELKKMKPKTIDKRIDYWLERFELSEYKHKKMKELSKGNQQKIQFISAMLHDPDLIILDEPFSGLDPFNIGLFREVILELQSMDKAILFSSHRLDYIETFSENIIVLIDGMDEINGKIEDVKKEADEFVVVIKGEFDKKGLETKTGVIKIVEDASKTRVYINDYNLVDDIFNHIKEGKIREFRVDLPTLEEIIVKRGKGGFDV